MSTQEDVTRSDRQGADRTPSITRADQIRMAVERDIVSGKLRPGTKLDEDTLAAIHGASRTPVREAFLWLLASKGLIELRAHAGAFVTTLSIVELAEMFEAMALLEAACAMLAAHRHTPDDRVGAGCGGRGLRHRGPRGGSHKFDVANARFHQCIYAASHNGYLVAQTMQLGNRLEAYRREATFHPGLMAITITEHEQILRAIFDLDEATAGKHMRSHLDTLRNDVVSMAMTAARRPVAATPGG